MCADCPCTTSEDQLDIVRDTHRMVKELHEAVTKALVMVEEMQNSNGGVMGMVMKMMAGKR